MKKRKNNYKKVDKKMIRDNNKHMWQRNERNGGHKKIIKATKLGVSKIHGRNTKEI